MLMAFSLSATNVAAEPTKTAFLEACDASPHIDEMSDCTCVYNEANHSFGDEIADLIPYIEGSEQMDKDIRSALNFISGKCES